MKELVNLLRDLVADGVVTSYAVFGAVAQMRYTEAVTTLDVDILVILPDANRLDALSSIYEYCARQGYHSEGEAIRVGAWPVQFIPVFSPLTQEAVETAEEAVLEGTMVRVVDAAHLAVIALGVGRSKDLLRVLSLLQAGSVTREDIARLAARHDLADKWMGFEQRFPDE